MYKSGSTSIVKNMNRTHILNLVRMHPDITAREISNNTGLQISTVLYMLKELLKHGLICESKKGTSAIQGGKPPVCWALNPSYGFVVGIELLSTEVRLVIVRFDLKVSLTKIVKIPELKNPKTLASKLEEIIGEAVREAQIDEQKVLCIGLGIPGFIDHKRGIIKYSYAFDFFNLNFGDMLSKLLNHRVVLDNDANAGAAAIKWLHGKNHLSENFLYITIQQKFSGMGVGFVIDHNIYRGAHGASGEIRSFLPHTILKKIIKKVQKKHGQNCYVCTLIRQEDNELPDISSVLRLARKKDEAAQFLITEIAKEISKKIVDLVNLFDPELVMIGGDISDAREFIQSVIKQRVRVGVISESNRDIEVRFSPFNEYSGAMGGAALALQTIFE